MLNFLKTLFFEINRKRIAGALLLLTLISGLGGIFFADINVELIFETFRKNYDWLINSYERQPSVFIAAYIALYLLVVILCLPGAVFMTLFGGWFFGTSLSLILVTFSASLGALIVFLWVKYVCPKYLLNKLSNNIHDFQKAFKKNAFWYLLFLRIVPLFPFWVINLIPALLGVSGRTYFVATLLGIIPGTLVYCSLGSNLARIQVINGEVVLDNLFKFEIFILLLCLAFLMLVPIVIKKIKTQHRT